MANHLYEKFRSPDFVKKVMDHDPVAMGEFVKEYTSHLYKAALGMGYDEALAQDLAQNTWLTFFDAVKKFEGRSHLRTFLFGIFYFKAKEFRRSRMKVEQTVEIDDFIENQFKEDGHWADNHTPLDPSVYVESQEIQAIVNKCLEHLPDNQKAVFTLKIIEEEDTEEICNILDISATNLRQLLYRGKNKLKDCVDRFLKKEATC